MRDFSFQSYFKHLFQAIEHRFVFFKFVLLGRTRAIRLKHKNSRTSSRLYRNRFGKSSSITKVANAAEILIFRSNCSRCPITYEWQCACVANAQGQSKVRNAPPTEMQTTQLWNDLEQEDRPRAPRSTTVRLPTFVHPSKCLRTVLVPRHARQHDDDNDNDDDVSAESTAQTVDYEGDRPRLLYRVSLIYAYAAAEQKESRVMESKVDRSVEKLGGKRCFPRGRSDGENRRDILVSSRSSMLLSTSAVRLRSFTARHETIRRCICRVSRSIGQIIRQIYN